MEFKDIVKKLRLDEKLYQRQLAHELNISVSLLSSYELGTSMPSFENLIKLADFFNISIDELIGRSNPKPSTHITNFLTKEEDELLTNYRNLCEEDKIKCQAIIGALKATPPAKKNDRRCV